MERRANHGREGGFALLLSVLLILMLVSLALAGLNTVQRDQQAANHLNRKQVALHAAEAGIAVALENLDQNGTPTIPATELGDGSIYPYAKPGFRADNSDGPAVEPIGTGGVSQMNLQPNANGQLPFQTQYWRVRVRGEAPGGGVARIEFVTSAIFAN